MDDLEEVYKWRDELGNKGRQERRLERKKELYLDLEKTENKCEG